MTEISIAETEWSILSAVRSALAGATVGGAAAFGSVTVTTSRRQAKAAQFRGPTPRAIVRYLTTVEDEGPEGARSCVVRLELILAAKVDSGPDESPRVQEVLRLVNAAKNALEAAPPPQASACGNAGSYHRRIAWGEPAVDADEAPPWAVCRLPVAFGFALDAGTSH